jgi:hypothetical protein
MSFRPSTVEEHSFDSSGVDLEAMEGPSGTSSQIAPLQNQQTSSGFVVYLLHPVIGPS